MLSSGGSMSGPVVSSGRRRHAGGGMAAVLAFLFCGALLLNPALAGGESSKGYDADLTLFSPEGRLYQVEYVMRAVGHYGCPAVGVQGDGCCVVACKRDVPDELVYPDSVSNIFRITDDIYSAATGLSGDVRYQVKRARLQALEYKRQYGSPMPSRLLTLAMADAAQVNTQHAALRPMACVSFVISVDDPTGPALFRVEPSGQVFQAWGTAAGRGSAASVEFLEEAYKVANAEASAGGQGSGKSEGGPPTAAKGRTSKTKKKTQQEEEEEGGGEEDEACSSSEAVDKDPAGAHGGSVQQSGRDHGNSGAEEINSDGGNRTTDSRQAESGRDSQDDDDDDGGNSAGVKGREAWVRRCTGRGSDTGASGAEPPGGGISGRQVGFGVVGEGETVELALQALSKASSAKEAPPLTDKNVEIAIASRDSGNRDRIRVCSRKEVRDFLGKMAASAERAPSTSGR